MLVQQICFQEFLSESQMTKQFMKNHEGELKLPPLSNKKNQIWYQACNGFHCTQQSETFLSIGVFIGDISIF